MTVAAVAEAVDLTNLNYQKCNYWQRRIFLKQRRYYKTDDLQQKK
jgi:hypothetical protein